MKKKNVKCYCPNSKDWKPDKQPVIETISKNENEEHWLKSDLI